MPVLKDGVAVLLDKEQTSSFGTTLWLPRSSDKEVDSRLAGFIGVPFVGNGIPTEPLAAVLSGLQPGPAMAAIPGSGQALAGASGVLAAPVTLAASAVPAKPVAAAADPAQPVATPESAPVAAPTAPATQAAPDPLAAPAPAPVAPAASCLAPSSAPAGSPYWCETPPPWAR